MYKRVYNGFSGVDISAQKKDNLYAYIQAVGYERNKMPISVFGFIDPRQWTYESKFDWRGHLIFTKFFHPEPIKIFDIKLRAADDKGKTASMYILDIEIVENGKEWTPGKMYEVDKQYTYLAKTILPWKME